MSKPAAFICRPQGIVAAVASLLAAGAQAQDTAPSGAAAATPAVGLEEVIVTARKREERLQDVPIAVTAFDPESLMRQNFVSSVDLSLNVPNMVVYSSVGSSASAQYYIRGVGQDDAIFTAEQGVGVYLDGVLLAKQQNALVDLIELDRIEVLRGPQGTLYGRNSTTGAVKFVTKRPDLQRMQVLADVTVGDYNRFDQRASISFPVIEGKLALKLDASNRKSDGYMHDVTAGVDANNIDRQLARVAALWVPSDDTSVYFAGDYSHDGSNIYLVTPLKAGPGQGGYVPVLGTYEAGHGVPNLQDSKNGGVVLDIDHTLPWGTFKSTTGYRLIDQYSSYDGDGTVTNIIDLISAMNQNQLTQEFQLTSRTGGPLQYTAGLFYFREVVAVNGQYNFQRTNNVARQTTTSYAAYFDGSYGLTDALKLSIGGRYTWDKKNMKQTGFSQTTGAQIIAQDQDVDFSKFTPRASLDYKLNPATLLYVSAARGYRTGGFSQGRPTNQQRAEVIYQPEIVTTYEGGMKTDLFDRRLRVNATYFYSKYNDMQLTFLQNGVFFVATADSRLKGLELEVTSRPIDSLTLRGTAGWLDGKYTYIPTIPGTTSLVGGLFYDAKIKQVPKFAYNVGLTHELPLGTAGQLETNIDYTWNDVMYHNAANAYAVATPKTGVLAAQIAFVTTDKKWRLALGGRNLTDEEVVIGGNSPNIARMYGWPRTWYFTGTYRY